MAGVPLPPNVLFQADGARDLKPGGQLPPGPTYQLVRSSIFDLATEAVFIDTDHDMKKCYHLPGTRVQKEWRRKGGARLTAWIQANHPPPAIWNVRGAGCSNGNNMNHRFGIMIRIPFFDNPLLPAGEKYRDLRRRYMWALDYVMTLPFAPPPPAGPYPWRFRPNTIAFDLMGSGPRGYGYDLAAEHALAAITEWFRNSTLRNVNLVIPPVSAGARPPVYLGEQRSAQLSTVQLLVPTHPGCFPDRIETAWRKAWDRYVEPGRILPAFTPPPQPSHAHLVTLQRQIDNANEALGIHPDPSLVIPPVMIKVGPQTTTWIPVPPAPAIPAVAIARVPARVVPLVPSHLVGILNPIYFRDQADPVVPAATTTMTSRRLRGRTINQ